jgi:hypothetical protein
MSSCTVMTSINSGLDRFAVPRQRQAFVELHGYRPDVGLDGWPGTQTIRLIGADSTHPLSPQAR